VGALSIAGGLVIIGATVAKTWWDSRSERVLLEPG